MALVPVLHVLADMFSVDPDWDFAVDGQITMGRVVFIDGAGYVQLADSADTTRLPLGLAGDNLQNAGGGTPYSNNLVVGSDGRGRAFTQNRVSDVYNETLASGKLTVYHGGGRFWDTEFVATDTFTAGLPVYVNGTGQITTTIVATALVGVCVTPPTGLPSGVPGTDVDQSISLGDFIEITLRN